MGEGIIDIKSAGKGIGQFILAVAKLEVSDNGEELEKAFSDRLARYDNVIKSVTKGYEDNFKENYSGAKNKIKRFFSSKRRGNLKDFKKSLELDTKNVEDFMKLLGAKSLDLDKKIAIEEKIQKKMEKMPKDNEKQKNEIKLRCYNDMSIKLNINSQRCEIYLDRLRDLCKKVGVSQKKAFSVEKVVNKGNKTKISRAGISNETSSYNDAYFGFQDAVDVCRNKINMAKLKLENLKKTYNVDDIFYTAVGDKTDSCKKYVDDALNQLDKIAEEAEGEYKKLEETLKANASKEESNEGLITKFTNYLMGKEGTVNKPVAGTISYYSNGVDTVAKLMNGRVEFIESLKNYYIVNLNMSAECWKFLNNEKCLIKAGKIPQNAPCHSVLPEAPSCFEILKNKKMDPQEITKGREPYYYVVAADGKYLGAEVGHKKNMSYNCVNYSGNKADAAAEVLKFIKGSAEQGKWTPLSS